MAKCRLIRQLILCMISILSFLAVVLGSVRPENGRSVRLSDDGNTVARILHRRALLDDKRVRGANEHCTSTDISISQRLDGSPGIPQYTVQITNSCVSPCAPRNIHIACGWFASPPLVNPRVFKRVGYDDCLVNNGEPLQHGMVIRFSYSNSYMYPLRLKSASFC